MSQVQVTFEVEGVKEVAASTPANGWGKFAFAYKVRRDKQVMII